MTMPSRRSLAIGGAGALLVVAVMMARGNDPAVPAHIRNALKLEPARRTVEQRKQVRDYFVEHGYARTTEVFASLHQKRARIAGEIAAIGPKGLSCRARSAFLNAANHCSGCFHCAEDRANSQSLGSLGAGPLRLLIRA